MSERFDVFSEYGESRHGDHALIPTQGMMTEAVYEHMQVYGMVQIASVDVYDRVKQVAKTYEQIFIDHEGMMRWEHTHDLDYRTLKQRSAQ
jgi:hypothetical protein